MRSNLAMAIKGVGAAGQFCATHGPVPVPGPHEVLIQHTAIGVNFIDVYYRRGVYPVTQFPCTLGVEAAGIVRDIGRAVTNIAVGDRVAYATKTLGAYCEWRAFPADQLVAIPEQIQDVDAASTLLKGLTAYYLLHKTYDVQAGTRLLVHAAAGGVGSLLTQWAKQRGAYVIGTAGSAEKASRVRALGCDDVILYRTEDVAARVRTLTDGTGVDVVYDGVGQATFAQSLDSIRPFGLMVSYGQASGPIPPFDIAQLAKKGALYVTRPSLFVHTADAARLHAYADALFQAMINGVFRMDSPTLYPLTAVAQAHEALESRKTTGALVLVPEQAGTR
jgi:NADPH:quinone reductase